MCAYLGITPDADPVLPAESVSCLSEFLVPEREVGFEKRRLLGGGDGQQRRGVGTGLWNP
jgi:hypothetical protein